MNDSDANTTPESKENVTSAFQRPLLIMGVERSGSTWLANILDSHPATQLFMEPFAPRMEIFPEFPDRLLPLRGLNRYLRSHLQEGFNQLEGHKYSFFQRRDQSPLGRALVYRGLFPLGEVVNRGCQLLGFKSSLAHLRFKNLNKNRVENPYLNRLPKDRTPSLTVLKELRLNFKVGVLNQLWPNTRILVILRNPLSQVASILRLLGEGALHDLRSALYIFFESVRQCRRFEKYNDALDRLDDDSLLHRTVAYWFLNYGTLIEDLNREEIPHRVVRHETLSREPDKQRQKLLRFAGLTERGATEEYVAWSSQASNQVKSVMDTQRDSQRYYLSALQQVDETLRSSFFDAAEDLWSHGPKPLRQYRDWLREHL